jgi:hypothetical protein
VLFLEVWQFLRLIFFLIVLRMAHMAHGATGTTATAARFPLFLVTDHFDDDQRANEDECKRDKDGCEILHDKVEYDHSVHLFLF